MEGGEGREVVSALSPGAGTGRSGRPGSAARPGATAARGDRERHPGDLPELVLLLAELNSGLAVLLHALNVSKKPKSIRLIG